MTVNPGVTTVTKRHATQFAGHYTHSSDSTLFTNAAGTTTIALQPFEALLTAHHTVTTMQSFIGEGDGTTGMDAPNVNDPVIAMKYYNLQGVEIAQPTAPLLPVRACTR
ncbi:hypothetical protein FACS1894176_11660 [Bacteroidia bacterium]|nr:hypothetical protein FACS1894176_11660 [Bacteroidia bacterium]